MLGPLPFTKLNLNGVWEFQPGAPGDTTPSGQKLAGEILVPFPVESALSGVMEHHDRLWYRRTFTVPKEWSGRRTELAFGFELYLRRENLIFVAGDKGGQ